VPVLAVAALATACTGGAGSGSSTPSTLAPGSPWVGALAGVTLPAPVNALTALDCVTALRCWAAGSTVGTAGAANGAAVIATANGGARWTTQPIPPTLGFLSDISCSDIRHCTAVGQTDQTANGQGAIVTTSDGGITWSLATIPPGVLDVTAVACQPNRQCLATATTAGGTAVLVASPGSPTWSQRGSLPSTLSGATSLSCPDSQHCWVTAHLTIDVDHVAGQVAFTTDGGASWALTAPSSGVGYLNEIACSPGSGRNGALPFTTTTVPVTTTTAPTTTVAPSTATTAVPSTTTTPPPAVSTTTTTAPTGVAGAWCIAVGTTAGAITSYRSGHGVVLTSTNGGSTWSSQPVASMAANLMGVSCTAVNACVAVGSAVALEPEAGVAILTGAPGRPWRRAAAVGAPQALTAVSCTSLSRCVLVGESFSEHLTGS
jgi:hypothetical protein